MKILVPLSEGFEEMEAVISIDMLRRAGIEVTSASTGEMLSVSGSRGIEIFADTMFEDVEGDDFDCIVIPGGMGGTRNNQANKRLLKKIAAMHKSGKLVAAICAGPLVLYSAGLITENTKFTCYPGCEAEMAGVTRLDDIAVVDGNMITSQGPGTTFDFALAIIRYLCGDEVVAKVADAALVRR